MHRNEDIEIMLGRLDGLLNALFHLNHSVPEETLAIEAVIEAAQAELKSTLEPD